MLKSYDYFFFFFFRPSLITKERELCFVCHAFIPTQYSQCLA